VHRPSRPTQRPASAEGLPNPPILSSFHLTETT
jgi:hypothetical protein